jgi:hypothetical protein
MRMDSRYVAFIALVVLGSACSLFRSNSNLKLLLSQTSVGDGTGTLFCPQCSPDGKSVYFLASKEGSLSPDWERLAALWRVSSDGSNPEQLLDGSFVTMTLSPDGKQIALLSNSLVLLDLSSMAQDTSGSAGSDGTGCSSQRPTASIRWTWTQALPSQFARPAMLPGSTLQAKTPWSGLGHVPGLILQDATMQSAPTMRER